MMDKQLLLFSICEDCGDITSPDECISSFCVPCIEKMIRHFLETHKFNCVPKVRGIDNSPIYDYGVGNRWNAYYQLGKNND